MKDNIIALFNLKDPSIKINILESNDSKITLSITKKLQRTFCPLCHNVMHSKGIYKRTVNHPILQDGRRIVLEINQRRWKCTNSLCQHQINDEFSFIDKYKQSTNVTDILIVEEFRNYNNSVSDIASKFDVSDSHVIEVFSRYVDMKRETLPEVISIDEVHVNILPEGEYALMILNFITGEPIDILPSRKNATTEEFFLNIPPSERNKVKYLISDMYNPYISFVNKYFYNAVSAVDSFHIIKLINDKLNNYCIQLMREFKLRDEQRHRKLEREKGFKIRFHQSDEVYLLKNFKWLLLKNPNKIDYSRNSKFDKHFRYLMDVYDYEDRFFNIDPNLYEFKRLKNMYLEFNKTYLNDLEGAKIRLNEIIEIYKSSNYAIFKDIAKTLSKYQGSIINSFITVEVDGIQKRLSNGPIESINRIPKDMIRHCRGFNNFQNFRNRFLFATRKNAPILAIPKSREDALVRSDKSNK